MNQRPCSYWRRSRIAARILLKQEAGRPLSARDRRLARLLAEDKGVSNRLIYQGLSILRGRRFRKEKALHASTR